MTKNTAAMEMIERSSPGTNDRKNRSTVAQVGTLGCGVESSRLPHWEQSSAFLGFTWSLGQSLTL